MRVASLTEEDIRVLSSLQVSEDDPLLPEDATRIYYTNADVDSYNEEKLRNLPGQLFVSKSVITSPVGCRPEIVDGKIDDTAFSDLVGLKVGSRIMLVYNVDVKDCLTNGQLGSVIGIVSHDSSQTDCVLVKFDDTNVGKSLILQYPQFQKTYPGAVPIFKVYVSYRIGGKNQHGARAHLLQLPLRLAWALTCHKVQGQTFPSGQKIIIKWYKSLQPGMAYVMHSRAKSLSDISIVGPFEPRQIRCNSEAKLICHLLELPENSPISFANAFMNSKKITICSVNIQSLGENLEDLKSDHIVTSCNVLLLSETWLESGYPDPQFHSRFLKWKHLKEGRGRGVSVYSTESNTEFQPNDSMIRVFLPSEGISLIAVYRTHQSSISRFLENLKDSITDKTALILGDFNCADSSSIERVLVQFGFRQIVSSPTHRAGNKLDLCFVRFLEVSMFLHPCYYSHHDSLCVTVNDTE